MSGFDALAASYRRLWTDTPAGQLQRDAVWRHARKLFPAGSRVLDLGCGTGDDAVRLSARGVRVTAIDTSPEMVRVARSRGVDAHVCRIQNMGEIKGMFDGVISNFGALNCVESLRHLREPLAQRIAPGGYLVICLMGRACIWETVWFTARGNFRKAFRRWKGEAVSSIVPRVFYPTAGHVRRAFLPEFELVGSHGIGVAVPPSYVTGLSEAAIQRLSQFDHHCASLPLVRSLGDHRLLIFRRGTE